MRISRVKIHNFRSVRDIEFECLPLMVLVGPNNHGKSNVVAAIEFALSTSAKPSREDFFSLRPPEDADLWVEVEFHEMTAQEKNTFKRYVNSKGGVQVRKTATVRQDGTVEVSYAGYVSEPSEWWLKGDAVERLSNREEVEKGAVTVPALKVLLSEKGKITKKRIEEFQMAYVEEHRAELSFSEGLESSPFLGTKNVGGGVLPDSYLVPAIRDLSDETKVKSTTMFGRLLQRAVQEMALRDPQFIELVWKTGRQGLSFSSVPPRSFCNARRCARRARRCGAARSAGGAPRCSGSAVDVVLRPRGRAPTRRLRRRITLICAGRSGRRPEAA